MKKPIRADILLPLPNLFNLLKKYMGRVRHRFRLLGKAIVRLAYRITVTGARRARFFSGPIKAITPILGDIGYLIGDITKMKAYRMADPNLQVVFLGSKSGALTVLPLFFHQCPDLEEIGETSAATFSKTMKQWFKEDCDLVIHEVGGLHPFRPKTAVSFVVPKYVCQIIDLSGELKNLISGENAKTLRQRINKCLRAGYSYRFSRSKADFDFFYHRLYRPFVVSRHGVKAHVTPYVLQWGLWMESAGGGLVLVTREDRVIAGAICVVANGVCYDMEMGVLDGDEAIFQAGINSFLLWCGLEWAKEQGARYYNMGPTPGWQSRNSFAWKAKWPSRVVREEGPSRKWRFYAEDVSSSLAKKIREIGFICQKNRDFYSIVFEQDGDSPTEVELAERANAARKKGLSGISVVAPETPSRFHKS